MYESSSLLLCKYNMRTPIWRIPLTSNSMHMSMCIKQSLSPSPPSTHRRLRLDLRPRLHQLPHRLRMALLSSDEQRGRSVLAGSGPPVTIRPPSASAFASPCISDHSRRPVATAHVQPPPAGHVAHILRVSTSQQFLLSEREEGLQAGDSEGIF